MWRFNLFLSVFLITSCYANNRVVDVKALQQKVAACDERQQNCLREKAQLERLEKLAIGPLLGQNLCKSH